MENDSFIRWLRGIGSEDEIKEWEQWLRLNDHHAHLVKQADRILNLPFVAYETPNIELEVLRLQKAIADLD